MYGIVPESDSSSKESMMKRELKKQQKYGTGEFSMPKMMPYNAHNIYNEPFPVFWSQCYYKVDTTYVSWIWRGHWGKVYHDRWKKSLDNQIRTLHPEMMNTNREWICWFCREGKAEWFIWKKIDPVKLNLKKPVPSYILQKSGSSANSYSQSQYISQKDNPSGEQKDMNNDTFQNLEEESWKYPERRLQKQSSEEIMKLKSSEELGVNEFKFQFDNEVIKCYTGSWARYYHLDWLVKSKFRCLFNSLKKDEFKWSLHFCKLWGQTSENSLLMQCLKCPTSFHMKCSRADLCIQKLSRRHMICGAHYQEHISDDSDRKEDALENHSKYHSSELLEQENQNEDESVRTGERQRSAAYKIDKQRLLKSKEENEMDEN